MLGRDVGGRRGFTASVSVSPYDLFWRAAGDFVFLHALPLQPEPSSSVSDLEKCSRHQEARTSVVMAVGKGQNVWPRDVAQSALRLHSLGG